jgi:hypothetical protein
MGRCTIYNFLFLKLLYYWSELKKNNFLQGYRPNALFPLRDWGWRGASGLDRSADSRRGIMRGEKTPRFRIFIQRPKKIVSLEESLIAGVLFFPDTL